MKPAIISVGQWTHTATLDIHMITANNKNIAHKYLNFLSLFLDHHKNKATAIHIDVAA